MTNLKTVFEGNEASIFKNHRNYIFLKFNLCFFTTRACGEFYIQIVNNP